MDSSQFGDYGGFSYDGFANDEALMAIAAPPNAQDFSSAGEAGSIPLFTDTAESAAGGSAAFEATPSRDVPNTDRNDDDEASAGNEKPTPSSYAMDDLPNNDDADSGRRGRQDGTDLGGKVKAGKTETPAWSELKTKAGKERKRLPLACIACRRKKIRCSGEKPACRHCLRSRVPCVYKVTARKAAPRTDYMAMLDKRLKRMEERIIKVIPKAEQSTTSSVPRAVLKPPIPGTGNSSSKSAPRKRNAEDAFGSLEAWARAPADPAQAEEVKANAQTIQESEDSHLLEEGRDALPPKDVQEDLAEVFFDNVYGQAYNLLHKPSYMRKLKNNALPPVLVLSVCAIAARFSANPKFHTPAKQFLRGEEWALPAREICTRRYEWPNITILTCLLILGLHEFGTCQGGRSWALGGQAIRMAFALQLHKDLDHDPLIRGNKTPLSFIDREIRRRIMWACFLMDRFNSSATDRPIFIKESDVRVCLPVSERCFQLDMAAPTETLDGKIKAEDMPVKGQQPDFRENMGVAAYMIRAVALWARIITYLNQGGVEVDPHPLWHEGSGYTKLRNEAAGFQSTMPETLRYSTANLALHDTDNTAKQFLLLHVVIQQNVLFLNRSAAMSQEAANKAPEDFLSDASSRTFGAANSISELLAAGEEFNHFISAPFAGYCAFTATVVHIMAIRSGLSGGTTQTNAHVEVNIRFLNKMRKHWGMFHWMVEHVRDHYRKALDAVRSGVTSSIKDAVPLLLYGDWFSQYPHGLADTDIMDPAASKKKEKGADGVLKPKSELQSVEEFFTTLSPSTTEKGEGMKSQSVVKRKQTGRRQSQVTSRASLTHLSSSVTESNSQRVASQISAQLQQHQQKQQLQQQQQHQLQKQQQQQQQQQQQRRYSTTHLPNTPAPNNAMGFNHLTVSTGQTGAFDGLSPISPVAMYHHAPHSAGPRTGPYTPDLMMQQAQQQAQQPNPLLQSMEQHMMLDGFAGNQDGIMRMLNGNQALHNVPMGTQLDTGVPSQRHIKQDPTGGHPGQNNNARDIMTGFDPQDTSWFLPFNMEPPMPNGEVPVDSQGLDAFTGLFTNNSNTGGNGMAAPNPLGGLRQGQ